MNKMQDHNGQTREKHLRKGNMIITLLLIGAVLIMAAVLINNVVTARTPTVPGVAQENAPSNSSLPFSCCAANQSQLPTELIGQEALVYYNATFQDEADAATVTDFGCHQEITVLKSGKPIRILYFNNGIFSDLGPIADETES